MGLVTARLALVAALAVTGCYEPDLRSCTVTCASPADCAQGQVCGTAGFCVGSSTESCNAETPVDAATGAPLALHVMVMGNGRIDVTNGGMCESDCTYTFAAHATVTATWVQISGGHDFMMWTTPNCMTQGQTCTFTMAAAQTLGAKFK